MTKHRPCGERYPSLLTALTLVVGISGLETGMSEDGDAPKLQATPVGPLVARPVDGPDPRKADDSIQKLGRFFFGKSDQKMADEAKVVTPVAEDYEEEILESVPRAPENVESEKITVHEKEATEALEDVYQEVYSQTSQFNAPELQISKLEGTQPIPERFESRWRHRVTQSLWPEQKKVDRSISNIYGKALNSTQIRAFARIPQVQDAVIREARGLFDPEFFAQGDAAHTDEPTGSILTTGVTGRFLQDSAEGQYGLRKRTMTGADISLSQRISTLDNNSQFLDPNPQSGSELVFSVAQPLLRGSGEDYVRSEIRIAELDRDIAASEFLRLTEEYLMEVNRAYWGVYLSRAAFLQRQNLLKTTSDVVMQLEERQRLDDTATVSELFRAKAALNRRKADVQRTKMAIRTAEQRLRALVRDSEIPLGASAEFVPTTPPILYAPADDVRSVAKEALKYRPEMAQASMKVRATAVRRSQALAELKPQLDLVGEVGYAGLDAGRDIRGAIDDLNDHGTEWRVGLRYSVPIGKEIYKARYDRRDLEFQQSLDEYRIQGETVLLEVLISYQDLLTAYQDMSGKYQSVLASRKEIDQIRDRMNLNDEEAGKTVAYNLQLLLNAMDRNQIAEEEFIVAIVTYNTAITNLMKAKGVLLNVKSAK